MAVMRFGGGLVPRLVLSMWHENEYVIDDLNLLQLAAES
jgi:hypothetical protein